MFQRASLLFARQARFWESFVVPKDQRGRTSGRGAVLGLDRLSVSTRASDVGEAL
jgi:hypothetical protein